jgi:hypothetical protein
LGQHSGSGPHFKGLAALLQTQGKGGALRGS